MGNETEEDHCTTGSMLPGPRTGSAARVKSEDEPEQGLSQQSSSLITPHEKCENNFLQLSAKFKRYVKRATILILLFAIVATIVAPSVIYTNPLNSLNVDRVDIGDSKERVLKILKYPDNSYIFTTNTFEYYSDEYKELKTQIDNASDGAEDDFESQLRDIEYKTTTIIFDEHGFVSEIIFNVKPKGQDATQLKEHVKTELSSEAIIVYGSIILPYKISYSDGSFYKGAQDINFYYNAFDNNYYPTEKKIAIRDYFWDRNIYLNVEIIGTENLKDYRVIDGTTFVLTKDGELYVDGDGYINSAPEYTEDEIKNINKIIVMRGIKGLGDGIFQGYSSLEEVIIEQGVISIGKSAFRNCYSLEKVLMPNSVSVIGAWAFANCTSLSDMTIPNSVECIDNSVFWGCSSLSEIRVPKGVKRIKDFAFNSCGSLEKIIYCGTILGWELIIKSDNWDRGMGEYSIHTSTGIIIP